MSIRLEARDYLNYLKSNGRIIRMARFNGDKSVGTGDALILNDEDHIAIMLTNCGDPSDTGIRAGDLVNFVGHPEAITKIVGSPARSQL